MKMKTAFTLDSQMKTCIITTIIGMMSAATMREAFAVSDVGNYPYVQSGPAGVFYARCIPQAETGVAGFTDIYRVQKERDELVDHYNWYSKRSVVLGWSPIAGKVGVMAIGKDEPTSLDKQVELSFYLGGKFLKSWTTADLKRLSAEVSPNAYGRKRAVFQVLGCEQIPNTNEYVFMLQFGKDKKVSFDILTGDQYRKRCRLTRCCSHQESETPKHALQRTRPPLCGCNPCHLPAGSLSLGRYLRSCLIKSCPFRLALETHPLLETAGWRRWASRNSSMR